jgi:hypothetical protein
VANDKWDWEDKTVMVEFAWMCVRGFRHEGTKMGMAMVSCRFLCVF